MEHIIKSIEDKLGAIDNNLVGMIHLGFKPLTRVTSDKTEIAMLNNHIIFKKDRTYMFYNKGTGKYIGRHQLPSGSKVVRYI